MDLTSGMDCTKIPFLLLAECEICCSMGPSTSRRWDDIFGTRYAANELSEPCMCEHGEYKLYRTDRMGMAVVGGRGRGEMHAGVTWGNWITMQRRRRRGEGEIRGRGLSEEERSRH